LLIRMSAPPEPITVLRGHVAEVSAVTFSPDSEFLYSGSSDGNIKIWQLRTRRPVASFQAHHSKGVLGLHVLRIADRFLSHGRDNSVITWDVEKGIEMSVSSSKELTVGSYNFCKFDVFEGEGEGSPILVTTPTSDCKGIDVWDLRSRSVAHHWDPEKMVGASRGMCMCLRFYRGQSLLPEIIAGFESGEVCVWSVVSGRTVLSSKLHDEPVISVAAEGRSLSSVPLRGVSGSADKKLCVFELTDEGRFNTVQELPLSSEGTSDLALRDDYKVLASAGWDGRVRIWGWKLARPLAVLNYHQQSAHVVSWSKDFKLLASGSKDTRIALWSIYPP